MVLRRGADPSRVEGILDEEMKKLATKLVDEDELNKAKNQLEALFLRNIQSVDDRAYGLGHYATTGQEFKLLFGATERYREVTADQVKRAAAKYLIKRKRTVIVALPKK